MPWFDVRAGRLLFRGRVTKQPVAEWLVSSEGARAVESAAREIRFSLIGRARSAERRIGRTLYQAMRGSAVRELLDGECDRCLKSWTALAYAPSLPRVTIALRRLVVVPRTMMLASTLTSLSVRLGECSALAALPVEFTRFLSGWILDDVNRAIERATPSPKRPIQAHESWACVGIDSDLTWVDPLWSGAAWRGHALLFEMPDGGLGRRQRKALETAIDEIRQALPGMSRLQRERTIRLAAEGSVLPPTQ